MYTVAPPRRHAHTVVDLIYSRNPFDLDTLVNIAGAAQLSDVCSDYCNGGCSFKLMPGNDCANGDDVTVLARCKHSIGYTAWCMCLINRWDKCMLGILNLSADHRQASQLV